MARVQLERRTELVSGALHAPLPAARPFRASLGVPELHAITRLPLAPYVVIEPAIASPEKAPPPPPPPPKPRTLEELAAFSEAAASGDLARRFTTKDKSAAPADEAPPPFVFEPAIEDVEVLRRLARDCLEDIANSRSLRKPNAIESWLDQAPFEQRLLDNLDAFVALGGSVLPLVSLFHAEAKLPDPERAFAVALALGSIEGSDTVGASVMTLKQSAPEEHPGWVEGLWLAPSPAVDAAMEELCAGRRPDLVALALDVLHARGTTPDEVIEALLERPEIEIQRRVARALASALPREDAVEALEPLCSTATDDELFLTSVTSLLRRGHGRALRVLREALSAPSPERAQGALSLLCLAGSASDADTLLDALRASPSPRLLRGIGRFGHPSALPPLLERLSSTDDPEIALAAAEALERITGAGLREVVEEPWEVELPPEAEGAGGIPVPMRKIERVIVAPGAWEAWLREHARELRADIKLRAGVPFSPLQIVDELEARGTPPDPRAEAALELALVTGIASLFSPSDWVARQRKHLAELRARVASLNLAPGAFTFGAAARAWDASRDAPRERRSRPAPSVIAHADAPAAELSASMPSPSPPPPPPPFQPSSPWASMLSAEEAAAIEAVPADIPGDTTLPIPPLEQARAAAKSPLPFRPLAPSSPGQTARSPEPSPADEEPMPSTLSPASSEQLREAAKRVLPFREPGASPPPAGAPRPDQSADLTELMQRFREAVGSGLPFSWRGRPRTGAFRSG